MMAGGPPGRAGAGGLPAGVRGLAPARAGGGAAALVVHAAGLHAEAYRELAEALAAAGAAPGGVFGLDLRGHGDAADLGPGEPLDWEPFAAEIAAAARGLRARSGGRLVLVGHSLGATSGLLAEARCPGLFWRMFCFEPVAFDPAQQEEGEAATQFLSRNAARRRAEFGSVEEARRRLGSKPPFGGPGGVTPRALQDIARHSLREIGDGSGRLRLKCSPAEESQTYIAGSRSNILQGENRRSLERVRCPVVIAAGTGVGLANGIARVAGQVAACLPDARVERFEALGHYGLLQDPEGMAARVNALLAPEGSPLPPRYLHFGRSRL